jgi:type IV pilus assembly protein PilE
MLNRRRFFAVNRRQAGFTLIELLIVMTIIGILMGIAYPNYQSYLVKTRRADAQSALTGFANALERHYTQNNSYLGAGTDANTDGVAASIGVPTIYPSQSPIDGTTKYYNLRIMAATMTTYTLRATPIGAQASDGYLELLSTGARRWDRNNDTDTDDANENRWD